MAHKHEHHHKKKKRDLKGRSGESPGSTTTERAGVARLEVVLKCGAAGSWPAVEGAVSAVVEDDVEIVVIYARIGAISKAHITMAETGGYLSPGLGQGLGQ